MYKPAEEKAKKSSKEPTTPSWVLHVDGTSNIQESRAGLILTNLDGVVMEYILRFDFHTTNNRAEYEALIASLNIAKEIGIDKIKVLSNS